MSGVPLSVISAARSRHCLWVNWIIYYYFLIYSSRRCKSWHRSNLQWGIKGKRTNTMLLYSDVGTTMPPSKSLGDTFKKSTKSIDLQAWAGGNGNACWKKCILHKKYLYLHYQMNSFSRGVAGFFVDFFPRDAMHKRGLCCHAVCVCVSVTFVHCVKTNKYIFNFFHRRVATPLLFLN